jgi:hypothetical protein
LSWQGNQGIALKRPKVAPQEIPQIDTARAKKNRFRMETNYIITAKNRPDIKKKVVVFNLPGLL